EQKLADGRLVENDDVVNGAQGRDRLGALALRYEGASVALETLHLFVAVDRDDKHVAERASAFEVSDVPDVKEVEAAVGEDDARAVFACDGDARDQSVALKYSRGGGRLLLFFGLC